MAFILICTKCCEQGFKKYAKYNGLCAEHYIENLETVICANNQRIKELESTVLDLQSELARKKYSLTVACNRVEELEDKLKIAISALKKVDDIAYEIDNKDISDIACTALEQLGELE